MLPKCDLSARALFFSISLTQHCHISICRCCRVASLSVEIDMCYFYLANVSHNFDNTSNCLPKLTFNELIWLALKLLFCRITYSIHPIYMQLSLLLLLIVLDLLYISKVLASQRASACLFKCFFFHILLILCGMCCSDSFDDCSLSIVSSFYIIRWLNSLFLSFYSTLTIFNLICLFGDFSCVCVCCRCLFDHIHFTCDMFNSTANISVI